jgi:hypothetical protein
MKSFVIRATDLKPYVDSRVRSTARLLVGSEWPYQWNQRRWTHVTLRGVGNCDIEQSLGRKGLPLSVPWTRFEAKEKTKSSRAKRKKQENLGSGYVAGD